MSWIQNEEREGTAVDATLQTLLGLVKSLSLEGKYLPVSSLSLPLLLCGG